MKVASAGRQSNCFDRPGDVQRKCSSIFSCSWSGINTCMAQGDSAVWGFQSCCLLLLCLLVEHMEGSCSYKKMRGKSQKHSVCVEGKKDQSADMRRENSLKMSSIRATVS